MLFDKLYPDAKVDDVISYDGDELIKVEPNYVKRCSMCDNFGYWVSVSFHVVFCSEDCLASMWNEYFDCLRKAPVREDVADEF